MREPCALLLIVLTAGCASGGAVDPQPKVGPPTRRGAETLRFEASQSSSSTDPSQVLPIVVGEQWYWIGRPTIVYRIEKAKLREMQFIDRQGKVASVDLRDSAKRWAIGRWGAGVSQDLEEAQKPEASWLDSEFKSSTGIAIVDKNFIFTAPPIQTILDAPGKMRVGQDEWDKLAHLAHDHFVTHVGRSSTNHFLGCEHREMLALGAALVAGAL